MFRNFLRSAFRTFANIPGWRTSRKIVVFESDDWGSIRMPSLETFRELKAQSVDVFSGDALRYNSNDTLASADDLGALFEILAENKDSSGRACVFTPVSLVANPDFSKIEASGFKKYHYEPFTETLKKYPGCENSFDVWQQGMREGIFAPQFHGREHLNVSSWLNALQNGHRETLLAFKKGMWGFKKPADRNANGYQAAFHLHSMEETEYHRKVIEDGLELFEKIFKYPASYFAAPNGYYNKTLEGALNEKGVWLINGLQLQREPAGNGKYAKRFHYLGQKNNLNQVYITRNCHFEPSIPGHDAVNCCLKQIKTAFTLRKPAIINTHRVNFIGSLNPANRDYGLRELKSLLQEIQKNWPEVEFMSTPELGNLIIKDNRD